MYALELAGDDDRFAAAEAATAAGGVEVVAPGLATATALDERRLRHLAYTHCASHLLARVDADVGAAAETLRGLALDRSGTVAVRARDVRGTAGVDTRAAQRALGDVLVDAGFAVDLDAPENELRALFAGDVCLLGWLAAESRRDYGDRQPTDRPFFQPGSMDPLLARAVVNLALADATLPGEEGETGEASGDGDRTRPTLLDPMCGTGGLLLEAGLVGSRPVGLDAQPKMVRGTRQNLRTLLDGHAFDVGLADATRLPVCDGAVEALAVDVPYGRQSKVAGRPLVDLVDDALAEARRVADRAVVVGDRDWSDAAASAGWTVAGVYERRVHRSLTRHVHVLA